MAKILIVDDDPDVVEACRLFLVREGHDVAFAYNRAEGMKSVAHFQPNLVILDIMMEQPDDGIAMAQELRRQQFMKPILMLTSIGVAPGLEFDRDNEMLPVDAFYEKPIDPATLLSKVGELLTT